MTGGISLEGLNKQTCVSKGLRGGVVRLVYMVSFLVPEGFQHSPRDGREEFFIEFRVDPETNTLVPVLSEDGKGMLYQDVDDKTVAERAPPPTPRGGDIPTTYVLSLKDGLATEVAARNLVEAERASGRRKIDNVIEFEAEAGHSPFVNMHRWTAEMLISEAGRRA
ncbi:hypothetical protein FJTKL_13153 [Diaporthe vaccinii]|uniref:Uncharacterized protein n=1 Tax=Diaporthe vaccinii TaxID=105482 RepID=A0ABR4EBH3_9PEZI